MCGGTELISGFIFAYLLLFIDSNPLLAQYQYSGCKFEPFLDNAATSAQPPSVKTWATSRDVTYWRKAGYDRSNRHFNLLFDTLVSSKSFRIWSGHYNNLVFVIVSRDAITRTAVLAPYSVPLEGTVPKEYEFWHRVRFFPGLCSWCCMRIFEKGAFSKAVPLTLGNYHW